MFMRPVMTLLGSTKRIAAYTSQLINQIMTSTTLMLFVFLDFCNIDI